MRRQDVPNLDELATEIGRRRAKARSEPRLFSKYGQGQQESQRAHDGEPQRRRRKRKKFKPRQAQSLGTKAPAYAPKSRSRSDREAIKETIGKSFVRCICVFMTAGLVLSWTKWGEGDLAPLVPMSIVFIFCIVPLFISTFK